MVWVSVTRVSQALPQRVGQVIAISSRYNVVSVESTMSYCSHWSWSADPPFLWLLGPITFTSAQPAHFPFPAIPIVLALNSLHRRSNSEKMRSLYYPPISTHRAKQCFWQLFWHFPLLKGSYILKMQRLHYILMQFLNSKIVLGFATKHYSSKCPTTKKSRALRSADHAIFSQWEIWVVVGAVIAKHSLLNF